jgi:hypothetical protein
MTPYYNTQTPAASCKSHPPAEQACTRKQSRTPKTPIPSLYSIAPLKPPHEKRTQKKMRKKKREQKMMPEPSPKLSHLKRRHREKETRQHELKGNSKCKKRKRKQEEKVKSSTGQEYEKKNNDSQITAFAIADPIRWSVGMLFVQARLR